MPPRIVSTTWMVAPSLICPRRKLAFGCRFRARDRCRWGELHKGKQKCKSRSNRTLYSATRRPLRSWTPSHIKRSCRFETTRSCCSTTSPISFFLVTTVHLLGITVLGGKTKKLFQAQESALGSSSATISEVSNFFGQETPARAGATHPQPSSCLHHPSLRSGPPATAQKAGWIPGLASSLRRKFSGC